MQIRASLAGVLAIVGFLTLVASNGVKEAKRGAESRRAGLVKLIHTRQDEVDSLGKQLVRLRADIVTARRRLSATSADDARRLREVQTWAGTTPMAGPGLEIRLSESHREAKTEADRESLSVHDVDLQLVVNALWAAGAEAVAVNGQRLVSTSPIRAAGETITVNFRPLVPPYKVEAIGGDKKEFERSAVAQRFKQWVADYGLGFSVRSRSKVVVPAFLGTLQLSSARPADPAPPPAPGGPGASPGMTGGR
ncbi:MAG TPA: DUF881 domain-containing protein [Acidimicrobiia bacterium]|nr:DUF881 domain-containing protein [Acidimicrobiia bacterium]